MADPPVLAGRGLEVHYPTAAGPVRALRGVDVAVARGALTVLAGPSGSGKSTLLRLLALVERPTAGWVELHGRSLGGAPPRRLRGLRRGRVVLVLQDPVDNLLGHLDVAGNLRAAAALARRRDVGADVPGVLDRLGLAGTAALPVRALSGGQQQRLAFATALVVGAEVLLADEPTSQLDGGTVGRVVAALRDVAATGTAVVVASHDEAVLAAGDDVVRLADGRRAG